MLKQIQVFVICLLICHGVIGCKAPEENAVPSKENPSALDLIIPSVNWNQLTIEDMVRRMPSWGIVVCLETIPDLEHAKFTLTMRNGQVHEILDRLTSLDRRYQWTQYQSYVFPIPSIIVVDVAPRDSTADRDSVLNMLVPRTEFKGIDVTWALQRLANTMPHLYEKVIIHNPSHVGVSNAAMNFTINLEMLSDSLKLRDVLNEISIRSGGIAWVYRRSQRELQFLYQ